MLTAELLLQLTDQSGQVIGFNHMLFDATSYDFSM
jgi:hypothetical protein